MDADLALQGLVDAPGDGGRVVGVGDEDFQVGNRAGQLEIDLRRRQRHEDEIGIVFVHADLEGGDDTIGLHPGHGAKRGGVALGRDQGDLVADR